MSRSTVILIAAFCMDGSGCRVIGDNNKIPWHLPKDLRLFRRLTLNHPIIMGRKTFESFGSQPLPKRQNIVLTRQPYYRAEGCTIFHCMEEALLHTKDEVSVFVIGGGEIYQQAMGYADHIILTEIFDENPNTKLFPLVSGNVFFPDLPANEWLEVKRGRKLIASNQKKAITNPQPRGLYFRVLRYTRRTVMQTDRRASE